MKAYINGELVELTSEEEAELLNNKVMPKITAEERVAAIESAIADLAILLANNENIKED